jgi:hypothetical protein
MKEYMHAVRIDDGEVELLLQARKERDWTILPTFKLRYLYQRLIALPGGDMASVREIAKAARIKLKGEQTVALGEVFGV